MHDGTPVYLTNDDHHNVSMPDGHCNSDKKQKSKRNSETSLMPCKAEPMFMPCGQVPWLGTKGDITTAVTPTMAVKQPGEQDLDQSTAPAPPPPKPHQSRRPPAKQQRRSLPAPRDGVTPSLVLHEDTAVGDGHRSPATSVSAKQVEGGTAGVGATLCQLDLWLILGGGFQWLRPHGCEYTAERHRSI